MSENNNIEQLNDVNNEGKNKSEGYMPENKKGGKFCLYALSILVILLLGMFVWKNIAVKNIKKQMENQRSEIVEKTENVITAKTNELLRLTTIPLVWAVRKEMIRENYDQINEYLIRLVKEPHIKQIFVVSSTGTVIVATDKKIEGQNLSSVFPENIINQNKQNEISISDDGNGNILIVAPVMGLNSRLGLLIMVYEPEKINIDTAS